MVFHLVAYFVHADVFIIQFKFKNACNLSCFNTIWSVDIRVDINYNSTILFVLTPKLFFDSVKIISPIAIMLNHVYVFDVVVVVYHPIASSPSHFLL